jgi:hypothetical protein
VRVHVVETKAAAQPVVLVGDDAVGDAEGIDVDRPARSGLRSRAAASA